MPEPTTLSENAVAALRFEIRGWRPKRPESRLPAYRELAAAGLMELVPGTEMEYRFTREGLEHREAILAREEERIERERYEPPDASGLSQAARDLLARMATERVEITKTNRPEFRELAAVRIVILGRSFLNGEESAYRWTYWGWHQRFELSGCAKES
jgi:hypothetical protein